ncbi:MAG TPA: uracil-DNA glycosylase family protein [Xanthomonadaceae bacterium]|nr:uracil-DNA glycosylase family protein [Xanthomonadaceae bacterium]
MRTVAESLDALLERIRACRLCEAELPLGPRPVLRAHADARILIVGQAPGTRVHQSGVPWNDASGIRLRHWLGVERGQFYEERAFAIVPMGFCYPGRGKAGDLPPRPECAQTWHGRLLPLLPKIELTLLVGHHAQAWGLGGRRHGTLTATVRAYGEYLPAVFPLPHPSPRNQLWLRSNPWFEDECLPVLRARVREALER